uniref:LysM domain-containing protein n=1 Tax=Acanthochromis polyacanthus TaxID=80966 RepID=A0A3Q1ENH9_9TELE
NVSYKDSSFMDYYVGPDDSLNSIALKFNVTPNKLVQLNKLFSRSVYPGQVRTLTVTH